MKWNIIAVYVVKLKAVLRSSFLINLYKIWYVEVLFTQGTSNLIQISSETEKFFPLFHIYVKYTMVK